MKYYLDKDDEIVSDGAILNINPETKEVKFDTCLDGVTLYYDGLEVEFDEDGKPFVHYG
jgi:hypothetical protein